MRPNGDRPSTNRNTPLKKTINKGMVRRIHSLARQTFDTHGHVFGRTVITVGCIYEIAALWANQEWLPPISRIVYEASNHKTARFAAWMFGGYALDHFYGD